MAKTETTKKKKSKIPPARKRGRVRVVVPTVPPTDKPLYPITHFGKFGWKFPEAPEKKPTTPVEPPKPQTQLYPIQKWKFDCAKYEANKEQRDAKEGDADVSNDEGQSSRPDPPSPDSKLPYQYQPWKSLKRTEDGETPRM
ncbi:hypothetical protein EST38_g12986 [Candolleomyces aberdarensis]|uniref:Uncharacterized protein n=1 Tax=Candolleomyces aberdarensis TaxID=2316362 RepID=A0A4Q2D110_9AGAR|nr:hypothetical protein EST38_g12986 [Candolleomyces aberdarensis]